MSVLTEKSNYLFDFESCNYDPEDMAWRFAGCTLKKFISSEFQAGDKCNITITKSLLMTLSKPDLSLQHIVGLVPTDAEIPYPPKSK